MSKLKIAVLVLAAAALAGAGIYFVKYGSRALTGQAGSGVADGAPALDLFGNPISASGGGAAGDAGAPPAGGAPGGSEGAPGDLKSLNLETLKLSQTYTHPDPSFSFNYPENFSVSAFNDETGETVLVQAAPEIFKSLNFSALSFQIYITPFNEEGPITAERIREDIPDMVIEQAKEVEVAGVKMLAFLSGSESAKTREVWFVREGYLYQITAHPEFDAGLSRILLTWKFE